MLLTRAKRGPAASFTSIVNQDGLIPEVVLTIFGCSGVPSGNGIPERYLDPGGVLATTYAARSTPVP